MKLFVEGGGPGAVGKRCRAGFLGFLKKAGLRVMPRIVACGSRQKAYRDYRDALKKGQAAVLLVDSEFPIDAARQSGKPADWRPWAHLEVRDRWAKPQRAADADCHLMVQCMESWFLADRETLASYFGQGFREKALPDVASLVEDIPKDEVFDGLKAATRDCAPKGGYEKGRHSFELLGKIDPGIVSDQSPWAKRFIGHLQGRMSA